MFSAFEVHGGIHALVSFCIRRGTIRGANGGGYTSCRSTISPTEKLILSHALRRMTAPSAEGAKLRFRLCGGEAVDGARLAAFQSPPPPLRATIYRLFREQTSADHGGSVSRRDLNPASRNRAHLAWARKPEKTTKPIPNRSSGEGVWGRGASLREAASPPESPHT